MTRTVDVAAQRDLDSAKKKATPDVARFEQPIALRPAIASDLGFVFQTWLKDFDDSPLAKLLHPKIYNLEQKRVIDRLCKTAAVVIACDTDFPDTILGWGCGELWLEWVDPTAEAPPEAVITGAIIHYLYVSNRFRRRGIGRRMLEHLVGQDAIAGRLPLFYSHLPKPGRDETGMIPNAALKMATGAQYNPYLAIAR